MRGAILVALIVSMTSVAKADIEVTDGGYRVTAYHPDGTSGTVKRDSFTVRGTGTYADEAVDIANRKSTERAKEFEKTMDRLIGCSLRPACPPPRPTFPCPTTVVVPCPTPCPPTCVPRCVPPPGAVPITLYPRWVRACTFQASVPGYGIRTFIVPSGSVHLYAARPRVMTGWIVPGSSRSCPISFLDAVTCVVIPDP